MKTIRTISLLLGVLVISFGVLAQNKKLNRTLEKKRAKEFKVKMKTFKKEGYKIVGSSRSIEVALLTHYDKLNSGKYEELNTISEDCPTLNLCDRKSLVDASTKYATVANSFIKGKVESAMGYDATSGKDDKKEMDRFFAAYEQKVSANVSGKIKKSFAVYSKKANKYEAFYYIDEEAAHKARMNALKQAQEETEANVEWGNTVSDYVNERPTDVE